jgi:hypothetical protein
LARPEGRNLCCGGKEPKTIVALPWLFENPAMLVNSGGCATRFAQTVLARYPKLTALLSHARRRLKAKERKMNSETVFKVHM